MHTHTHTLTHTHKDSTSTNTNTRKQYKQANKQTNQQTNKPTNTSTDHQPTEQPSNQATKQLSNQATKPPSNKATKQPTIHPTNQPTNQPTNNHTKAHKGTRDTTPHHTNNTTRHTHTHTRYNPHAKHQLLALLLPLGPNHLLNDQTYPIHQIGMLARKSNLFLSMRPSALEPSGSQGFNSIHQSTQAMQGLNPNRPFDHVLSRKLSPAAPPSRACLLAGGAMSASGRPLQRRTKTTSPNLWFGLVVWW